MGLMTESTDIDDKNPDQGFLDDAQQWYNESENLRSSYDDRWAKNMKLIKGEFPEDEATRSKVRKRSKVFFRKIWATNWRLVAAFRSAFLGDRDIFKIEGRDTITDPYKAKILHYMTEYRKDVMLRTQSLFVKFIWIFRNIVDLGWAVGKMRWNYNPDLGIDEPEFTVYPNEQVFPDLTADTKENMKYIIFENFLSKSEMEELNYENIDKAEAVSLPSNIVRQTRFSGERDPLQNPGENEYPSAGKYTGQDTKESHLKRYRAWEIFYKKDGKWMFAVTNQDKCILQKSKESPFGKRLPVVMGLCLTEAHKLIGEGFPQPLEGPQESYNANLNQRKDNIALALNKGSIVSRYGNVDLKSLVNSRPGGITLADDINAVKEREIGDVTQSSYMEAAADDSNMEEMSGVTPGVQGMGKESKATVAQINFAQSSAKIDLYISIVAETFVRDFFSLLAYMIQLFETDEKVFRIANEALRKDSPDVKEIYDLDFEADCIVNVGLGTVGRDMEIKTTLLCMDRAIMANQAMVGLAQTGMVPREGIRLFNLTAFMEELLPMIGKKEIEKYFFMAPPPQPQAQWPGGGGQGGAAIAGRSAAQLGQAGMAPENQAQVGGLGGI